jgi:hypothetical protein
MQEIPQSQQTPFHRVMGREARKKDKEFIGEVMVLDWRDRPTTKELLEDGWFKEDGEEKRNNWNCTQSV